MKLIDLINKISNDEVEPILYFRINTGGHNFILKYLYGAFIVDEVKSSFNESYCKKGDYFNNILLSLNNTIEIIDKGEDK